MVVLRHLPEFLNIIARRPPDTEEFRLCSGCISYLILLLSMAMNVVVIGGSSGIGYAIVRKFATEGHNVFFTYFSNIAGAKELKNKYNNVDFCYLDQGRQFGTSIFKFVSKGEIDCVETFETKVNGWLERNREERVRKVDILINNAALGSATVIKYIELKKKEKGISEEMWNKMSLLKQQSFEDEALLKVNSLGPMWVTEVIKPIMRSPLCATQKRDYGTIVFMGSVGGSFGVFPEYRASDLMSKAAVTYLSKHLAAENIKSHIDVICLSPGATLTDMFRQSTLETCVDPSIFTSQMPKKRLINPDEVADAAYSLSTEKWGRIFHGAVLDASLGLGVRPGLQTETACDRGKLILHNPCSL